MSAVFLGIFFVLSLLINCGVLYVAVKLMNEKPGIAGILIIGTVISLVGLLPGLSGAIAASIITIILLYKMCDFNIIPEGLYILFAQRALNFIVVWLLSILKYALQKNMT